MRNGLPRNTRIQTSAIFTRGDVMQRARNVLAAGLVLGLLMSLSAPAQAQVFYVQSSSFQAVPVSRSVVVARSFGTPHYYNSFGVSQAWSNRISASPVYFEPSYFPESGDYYPAISSRSIVVSPRVVSSRPVLLFQPVIYDQAVIYSEPMIYSEPVVVSQPVRVYGSVISSPRITREEIECRPGHYEYEQKGKFEAFDGRRIKTYRYEYEVDQRHGRTKYKFDIDE